MPPNLGLEIKISNQLIISYLKNEMAALTLKSF